MLEKLRKYGIRELSGDWFKSYLENRKQYCAANGYESRPRTVTCGIPQGKVIVLLAGLCLLVCTAEGFWSRRAVTCNIEGTNYNAGKFITDNCKFRCNCNYDGTWNCNGLCESNWVSCYPGQRKITVSKRVAGSRCTCNVQKCASRRSTGTRTRTRTRTATRVQIHTRRSYGATCLIRKKRHRPGTFISKDCKYRCLCRNDGSWKCDGLCGWNWVSCYNGQREITVYKPVSGSSCRCAVKKCV
eukprot:Seg4229.1 transcript_id=Seg4229.1/GoldUCD/mRNA.D3Y31 product="hypothetical protein" protein_id=Seg4229.1/GoldUCD/D3Y31